jgi:DNA-binding LacI/PurR family transcriptional regulator
LVTIAKVARKAGVSPSTVSYVLSRKRSISDDTRFKVEAAIEALGYHPHAGARALASNRSNILALMMPLRGDMFMPVITEIAMAVATEAREFGQDVLLLTKDEGTKGVRRVAGSGLADAMILMDVELEDNRIPLLREADTPAVLIGLPRETAGLTCIDLDFDATGAACVDHLADLGHRDIALIGESPAVHPRHAGFAIRTLAGFQRRAGERGLRAVHRTCEGSYESVAGVLARILEERPTTTGFVVQNEAAIAPLLSLLRLSKRVVPEDSSIVAICPDQMALHSLPRLTSVSIPGGEMGRHAVRQAMAQLEGTQRPAVMLIPPRLTIRESSAVAPAS